MYQVIGDPKFADRVRSTAGISAFVLNWSAQVERITYNALPATLTGGEDVGARVFAQLTRRLYRRYVVAPISATAESNRSQEHDAVRLLRVHPDDTDASCNFPHAVTHSRTTGMCEDIHEISPR